MYGERNSSIEAKARASAYNITEYETFVLGSIVNDEWDLMENSMATKSDAPICLANTFNTTTRFKPIPRLVYETHNRYRNFENGTRRPGYPVKCFL